MMKRDRIVQDDVEISKDLCPYESCMEGPVETPWTDKQHTEFHGW